MKVTVDTNILIRAVVQDDKKQASAAVKLLKEAETIAITLPCLCEFVWVLRSVYSFPLTDISAAIQALLNVGNIAADRPAIEAAMAILNAGGDFADGLIAYEGTWLGGETFFSLDKKAVALLTKQGQKARLLT